jgi:hypothetical protein
MSRRLRDELLLHPYELPFVLGVLVVAIVFTAFPDLLEHTAVGFETRGAVHHLWHHSLTAGAALNLAGRWPWIVRWVGRIVAFCGRKLADSDVGLTMQGIGLTLLLGCLALNLSALASAGQLGGLAMAIRLALMTGIAVRLFIIIRRPTVDVGGRRMMMNP